MYIQKIQAITGLRSQRYKSLDPSYLKSLSDEELVREFTRWANQWYTIARRSYDMMKQNKLKRDGKRLNDELKARGYKDLSMLENKLRE
jgi:hypothetical protein